MNKKNSLELVLESYPIRFTDMIIEGDIIWFSACNFNGFFRGSLLHGSLEYMGSFLEKGKNGYGLHNFITKYEGKIYLGPTCSKYIVEFDVSTSQYMYYEVPGLEQIDLSHAGLVGQFEKYLVVWNTKNVDVVRFDMEKKEFEIVKTCEESIFAFAELNKKESAKFRRGFCIKDGCLYITSVENNMIMQVDVKKNEKKLYFLDDKVNVHSVCSDGNKLWVTSASNQLLEWEPDSGKIKECVVGENVPLQNAYFSIYYNKCLYFALREIDEILIYHLEGEKIERMTMYTEGIKYNGADGFPSGTIMLKAIEDEIWAFNSTYSTLQCITGNNIRKQKLELNKNFGQLVLDRQLDSGYKSLYEDEMMNLQDFIKCLCVRQTVKVNEGNKTSTDGKYLPLLKYI